MIYILVACKTVFIYFRYFRMPIDFYYTPGSPPCRTVLLTAKALGLELNLKPLDLHHGEHLKPEFVKVRNVQYLKNHSYYRTIQMTLVNRYVLFYS